MQKPSKPRMRNTPVLVPETVDGSDPTDKAVRAPTSARIMDVASHLFSTVGYEATSMRAIARSVGVQPASLYNHYPSKEHILWAIIGQTTLDLERQQVTRCVDPSTATQKLRSFVRIHVGYHAANTRDAKIANVQLQSLSADHLKEIVAFRARYEAMLADLLQEGCDSGEFTTPDSKLAAFAILQMGIGVSYWFRPGGPLSVDQVCDVYEDFALSILGAPGRPAGD
jgi:AcrR family transcriptional regulator